MSCWDNQAMPQIYGDGLMKETFSDPKANGYQGGGVWDLDYDGTGSPCGNWTDYNQCKVPYVVDMLHPGPPPETFSQVWSCWEMVRRVANGSNQYTDDWSAEPPAVPHYPEQPKPWIQVTGLNTHTLVEDCQSIQRTYTVLPNYPAPQ